MFTVVWLETFIHILKENAFSYGINQANINDHKEYLYLYSYTLRSHLQRMTVKMTIFPIITFKY